MGGACDMYEGEVHRVWEGIHEGKYTPAGHKHRCKENNERIFNRMEVSELDPPGSGQGAVVGSFEHSNEPLASTEMGIS